MVFYRRAALLERRADEAAAALDRVALADANNARLPFLIAQLTQMQLRDYLDSATIASMPQQMPANVETKMVSFRLPIGIYQAMQSAAKLVKE